MDFGRIINKHAVQFAYPTQVCYLEPTVCSAALPADLATQTFHLQFAAYSPSPSTSPATVSLLPVYLWPHCWLYQHLSAVVSLETCFSILAKLSSATEYAIASMLQLSSHSDSHGRYPLWMLIR